MVVAVLLPAVPFNPMPTSLRPHTALSANGFCQRPLASRTALSAAGQREKKKRNQHRENAAQGRERVARSLMWSMVVTRSLMKS